jgi:DNA repair exonuclease SbcCD ATPase subunit
MVKMASLKDSLDKLKEAKQKEAARMKKTIQQYPEQHGYSYEQYASEIKKLEDQRAREAHEAKTKAGLDVLDKWMKEYGTRKPPIKPSPSFKPFGK